MSVHNYQHMLHNIPKHDGPLMCDVRDSYGGNYSRNSTRVHGITFQKTIMLNYHVNNSLPLVRPKLHTTHPHLDTNSVRSNACPGVPSGFFPSGFQTDSTEFSQFKVFPCYTSQEKCTLSVPWHWRSKSLAALDSISVGSGAGIAASSHRGSTSKGTKV